MEHILNCTGHDTLLSNIVTADNCELIDASGQHYLDLCSGVWCTALGHSHPRVVNTITQQSQQLMHSGFCYNSQLVDSAAAKLLSLVPYPNGRAVFLSSGSEAVELGMSLALHITGKRRLLTLSDSYLSAFGRFAEAAPQLWHKFDWLSDAKLESIPYHEFAAFIFEPGSSSGLVRFPPTELIQHICQQIHAHGGLVLANEVTTGMGRTGKWFGYQHYPVTADLVAVGKGLGNGYPVSCLMLSAASAARVDPHTFHYSQSHQNDPLGAAVATTVIATIEQNHLLEAAQDKGHYLLRELQRLQQNYGIIKAVRGRGLMLAIEFKQNAAYSFATLIHQQLLQQKIIVVRRPKLEVFRIDPALTITQANLDRFLGAMQDILARLSGKSSGIVMD